jgi:septal ring factor EnvC (AmiA/AmiB activator)
MNKENTFEYDELIRLIKGLKQEIKAKSDTEEILLQKIEKLRNENKLLKGQLLQRPSSTEKFNETISKGKVQKVFEDGRKEILYRNGSIRKIIYPNNTSRIYFANGDI